VCLIATGSLLASFRFPALLFFAFAGFPVSLFNGLRANSSAIAAAFRILWRLTPANILLPPLGGDPLSLHLTFPLDGESGSFALLEKLAVYRS
jgi:hypothetical protein